MIEKVLLRDYDDNVAPPGRVLEVGLVGDQLFLTISQYEETNREAKSTKLQEIAVSSAALAGAVAALHAGQAVYNSAKKDKN